MSLSDLNQPFKYSGLLSNLLLCSYQILFFIPVLLTSDSLISQSIGSSCKNSSKDISSLVPKVYRDFLPRFRFSLMTCDIVEASDTADTATDISEEVSESATGEVWLSIDVWVVWWRGWGNLTGKWWRRLFGSASSCNRCSYGFLWSVRSRNRW